MKAGAEWRADRRRTLQPQRDTLDLSRLASPERRTPVGAFLFRLETEDGAPAEAPTLSSAVPDWRIGHTIHLGKRTLRVTAKRDDDADQPPVLMPLRRWIKIAARRLRAAFTGHL